MDSARHFLGTAAKLNVELNDKFREGAIRANLAEVNFGLGLIDAAIEEGRSAIAALRVSKRKSELGIALYNMSEYLLAQGDLDTAMEPAIDALQLASDEGGYPLVACLQHWALLACHLGKFRAAAGLIGFVNGHYAVTGGRRIPSGERHYERLSELLAKGLSADDIEIATAEGAAWTEQQAVAFTRQQVIPAATAVQTARHSPGA